MVCPNYQQYIALLRREIVPALGCTEPAAVALAAANAREALGRAPEAIEVRASGNILKNGMGVGIPGTGTVGLQVAAALGAIAGNPGKGLEVLGGLSGDDIRTALEMVETRRVTVQLAEVQEKLYIDVRCQSGISTARAVISGAHANIVSVERDGNILLGRSEPAVGVEGREDIGPELSLEGICEFSNAVSVDDVRFILDGAQMNRALAEEGLRAEYGLGVGRKTVGYVERGLYPPGLIADVVSFTAAAVDARMAGADLPAMSNSGSGNQGITVMLPVLKTAERLGRAEEDLIRALVLANLVAIHLKRHLGILSALCGVVCAATGASCGITRLLGGDSRHISSAVKNMIANLSGMVCDGAKSGCALKASTGAAAAVEAALLAADGVEVSHNDGIIERDIENTIRNFGILGKQGMRETDRVILGIMTCK